MQRAARGDLTRRLHEEKRSASQPGNERTRVRVAILKAPMTLAVKRRS